MSSKNEEHTSKRQCFSVPEPRREAMRNKLAGYWECNEWKLSDPVFDSFPEIHRWRSKCKSISFDKFTTDIRDELKYFCINGLEDEIIAQVVLVKLQKVFNTDFHRAFKRHSTMLSKQFLAVYYSAMEHGFPYSIFLRPVVWELLLVF
jgi:hypothetical protein